jgi:hypothetical protein
MYNIAENQKLSNREGECEQVKKIKKIRRLQACRQKIYIFLQHCQFVSRTTTGEKAFDCPLRTVTFP